MVMMMVMVMIMMRRRRRVSSVHFKIPKRRR
jgi:hypothetical protein